MINSNLIKFLLGLCVFLLLILSIEWLLADSPEQHVINSADEQQNQDLTETLPSLGNNKPALESYSDMVERPLFITGRRAAIESEQDAKTEDAGKIDDVTLYGIYSIKDKTFALFSQKGGDSSYIKKTVDEEVSGWSINDIQSDRVTVEQSGQQQTLMLRKPKPKVAKKPKPPLRKPRKSIPKKQK